MKAHLEYKPSENKGKLFFPISWWDVMCLLSPPGIWSQLEEIKACFQKIEQQISEAFINYSWGGITDMTSSTWPILVGMSLENHKLAWLVTENLECPLVLFLFLFYSNEELHPWKLSGCFNSLPSRLEWAPPLLLNCFKNECTLLDHSVLDDHSNYHVKVVHCNSTGLFFGSFLKLFNCLFCFVVVAVVVYFNPLLFHSWFALLVLVLQCVNWLPPLSSVDSCRLSGRDLILFLSLF